MLELYPVLPLETRTQVAHMCRYMRLVADLSICADLLRCRMRVISHVAVVGPLRVGLVNAERRYLNE